MSYVTVLDQIKKGQIKSIYLLYGEETFFIRQIEQAVIKAVLTPEEMDMNLITLEREPTENELMALIETVPFMGGRNVIVVRGTTLFRPRKAGNSEETQVVDHADERLLELIANMPDYAVVIFSTIDKVDKRRKLFKMMEKYGVAVEVAHLKARDVRGWLNSKLMELNKKMTSDGIEYFLGIVSLMSKVSLGFLNNELDKIALFVGERTVISQQDLVEIMSAIPEISVFSMIDAVSQRQVGKALQLIGEQLQAGEHPLKLISLLARQVRMMWQAKDMAEGGYNSHDIAGKLGLVPFIGEKMLKQSRNFTVEVLKRAMVSLATADRDLKSGRANPMVLEEIIIAMCKS